MFDFNWFSLDYIYYPVSGDHVGLVQAVRLSAWAVELLRLGAVGDVPRLHPARHPVQAVRPPDRDDAPDAGIAAADQGAAEEVRQGPPADGAGDAEAPEGPRLQPDPGLPPDARADPRLPRAVPRAAVVQPDAGRLRPAEAVGRVEPLAGQLLLQRHRRRALPRRASVRCAARRDDDPDHGCGRVQGVRSVRQ